MMVRELAQLLKTVADAQDWIAVVRREKNGGSEADGYAAEAEALVHTCSLQLQNMMLKSLLK